MIIENGELIINNFPLSILHTGGILRMIESCAFGVIVIDGKKYSSDVIIYPDGHVEDNWRRQNGHVLLSDDITKLIAAKPDMIVAGAGMGGRMIPDRGLEQTLREKGILLIAKPNPEAMEAYNFLLSKKKQVGACFHLTC